MLPPQLLGAATTPSLASQSCVAKPDLGYPQYALAYLDGPICINNKLSPIHHMSWILSILLEHGDMECGDPRARPDPVGESEPKPRGRSVEIINQIPFISVLLNFSYKSVTTQNPDLTWLADPSRSPVYSDISIILSKHLVYFIHFKFCKFRGSNSFWQAHKTFTINKRFITFTFNKMPLQKY